MPARTKKLESRVKEGAIALIFKHLGVRVEPDEVGAVHFRFALQNSYCLRQVIPPLIIPIWQADVTLTRQPDDNRSIILKFFYVGDGSAFDEILKRSRKVRPRGFYAKLLEVQKSCRT